MKPCAILLLLTTIEYAVQLEQNKEHAYVGNLHGDLQIEQGQTVYRIPIDLPKGPNNIQPDLHLVYSSESGNGPIGLGWNFDIVSVISRCPQTIAQDGRSRGIHYDPEDRFCLDGQRLVVVKGQYGADGSEYRTEVDSYRKIVASGQHGSGPESFRVWTKDGMIYDYGRSVSAHIIGNNQNSVHQWNLQHIKDRSGNTVTLKYLPNTTSLSTLTYKNTIVKFEYESRPDNTTSYFKGEILSNITERLSCIEILSPELLRQYFFTYHQHGSGRSNQSILTLVELCDAEMLCMKPLQLKYNSNIETVEHFVVPVHSIQEFGAGWSMVENLRFLVDMNRDGLPDIVGFDAHCVKVAINDGNQKYLTSECWVNAFGHGSGWRGANHPREIADVDGDGLPDVVGIFDDGVHVSFNTGSFLKAPVLLLKDFGHSMGWRTETHLRIITDVNGDGRADILGFFNNEVKVSLSTGHAFGDSAIWSNEYGSAQGWQNANHPRFVKDVNGDGLPDIVGFGQTGIFVATNTGSSFKQNHDLWSAYFHFDHGWRVDKHPRFLIDMNGDGLEDVVGFATSGLVVSYNTGTSFTQAIEQIPYTPIPENVKVTYQERFVADVTGDGLPDIIFVYDDGIHVSCNQGHGKFAKLTRWVDGYLTSKSFNQRQPIDINGDGVIDFVGFANEGLFTSINPNKVPVIEEFSDSFNNVHSVSYMSLPLALKSGHYERPLDVEYPYQSPVTPSIIATSVERNKGTMAPNATSYYYGGFRIDVSGRGSQGFQWRKEIHNKNRVFLIEQEQTFPLTGCNKKTEHKIIHQISNAHITTSKTEFSYQVSSKSSVHTVLLSRELTVSNELDGKLVSESETIYSGSNGFGDPLKVSTQITGGGLTFTKTTVNKYRDDTKNWLVGQLVSSKVLHDCPCGQAISRHASYEYHATKGYILTQIIEPGHELSYKLDFKYDKYGNVISKTDTPINDIGKFRRVTKTYADDGIFVKTSTNGKGHCEMYGYNEKGYLINMTGPNGLQTKWTYDSFGRKIKEVRADGTETKWTHQWDSKYPGVVYTSTSISEGRSPVTQYSDALGRILTEQSVGFDEEYIFEEFEYNQEGLLHKQSYPHFESGYPAWNVYRYDEIGRLISKKKIEAYGTFSEKKTKYGGLNVIEFDPLGHATYLENDVLGRVVQVTDELGAIIQYKYDCVGNLIKTIDTDGHSTSVQYDILGHKTLTDDPNMGRWEYKHNVFGELVWQRDGNKNILRQEYDVLGRLVKRSEPERTTFWTFDNQQNGVGKIGNVRQTDEYSKSWEYDSFGRESKQVTNISDQSFESVTKYDQYGRVIEEKYPNEESLYRTYDDQGYLVEIGLGKSFSSLNAKPLWKALDYDAFGNLKMEQYGNGLTTNYEYNSATHLVGITTHKDGGDMFRHLKYSYDQGNNLKSRTDVLQGITETFGYDRLDRLVQSTVVSGTYRRRQNWDYFNNGNIQFNDAYGLGPFIYDDDKPHAVVKAGKHTYVYDANGNAVKKDGKAIKWTSYNKPSQFESKDGDISFKYGPDRGRYLKTQPNGQKTFYVGQAFEKVTSNKSSVSKILVYGVSGRLIGIVSKNSTIHSPRQVLYAHTDNLGSVDTLTNETSQVVENLSYDAFGLRRTSSWIVGEVTSSNTVRGYTGHEHIDELGLIHMNGRVYDAEIGRFLSPDPHVQSPTKTQALNRYSYVLNNPLKHNDPSGYFSLKKFFRSAKRMVKSLTQPRVLAAAVITFATGGVAAPLLGKAVAAAGLTGATAIVTKAALVGAASGFTGGTVMSGSIKGGLQGAAGGALLGGIGGYYGSTWNIERVAAQATAGGLASELGGGKFKDGLATAGLAAGARYLYNKVVQYDVRGLPGGKALQKTEDQRPWEFNNNIGMQDRPVKPDWFDKDQGLGINWGEGGGVSRTLNAIPGVNAVAGMHDVFQISMDKVFFPGARDIFNIPAMIPAVVISYSALQDGPMMPALLVDETRKNKH